MNRLEEQAIQQVTYLVANAVETRIGFLCLYENQLLCARNPEELYIMLQSVWRKV